MSDDNKVGRTFYDLLEPLAKVFQRHPFLFLVIAVVIFFGIWGVAHWTAKPGEYVSVWFGLIEYTKGESTPVATPTPTVIPTTPPTPSPIPTQKPTPTSISPTVTPIPKPTSTQPPTPTQQPTTYYDVILVLPSRMSGADVLVDGQSAIILDRKLTFITIRVEEKQTNHQITVIKDDDSCTTTQFIRENNVRLYPCQ